MEFNKWQITCSLIEPTRRSPYYVELQLPVTTERATSHPHSAPPSRRAVAERRTSEAARDVGARSGNERCQFSLASIERNIGAKCKQLGPGSQQLDSLTFFFNHGGYIDSGSFEERVVVPSDLSHWSSGGEHIPEY